MTTGTERGRGTGLAEQLERWVRLGLVTFEQAERIREYEQRREAAGDVPAGPARGTRPGSLVTEGLGYVGGVLVVIAAMTIAVRYWSGLGAGGRLALVFGASLLLLVTGAAVPAAPGSVGYRLRAVTWLLAVVAFGGGIALLADEVLGWDGESVALAAATGAGALAAVLWWRHRTVLQQAALVAAGAFAVGTAVAHLPSAGQTEIGLAVWGWGAVWLLLGWARIVAGRAAADVCGGAVAVSGAVLMAGSDEGSVLAIATAGLLVAVGVFSRDLVLLGVGSAATLVIVPVVMGRWFPDTLVAPLALLAAGALLVAGALLAARRRKEEPGSGPTGDRSLDRRVAIVAAALLVLAVLVYVVVVGLR